MVAGGLFADELDAAYIQRVFFRPRVTFRRFLEAACGQTVNEKAILVSATELLSGAATADETHVSRGRV